MSADYRIRSVVGEKDWEGQYGPMKSYELFLEGADAPNATVTLTQKRETARPQEGQVIHGHIEDGNRGPKLKKDQQASNSGGPSGQTDDFARRPEHPRNEARMIAQGALANAPAYLEQMLTAGVLPKPENEETYWKELARVADRLEARLHRTVDQADTKTPDERLPF